MTLLITNPPKITYLSSNRWEHGFPLSILNYPQLVSLFLASIRTPSPSFSSLEHHRQHQNVIRSHVFSLNKLRMHNFWYFLHNNIFFPMSNVEFIIVYFAKFAVSNNRGQAGEDWSECALFLPPCLLSASSSMGNQVKRVRQERSNGGSRQRRGREGVMRELALTCQCRGSRQLYHTLTTIRYIVAMLALFERLAMFRNLPLASHNSQLFKAIRVFGLFVSKNIFTGRLRFSQIVSYTIIFFTSEYYLK